MFVPVSSSHDRITFAVASFAQDLTVKGKVTDTTGETVIGANVTVRGTTNGIITDIDGNYTLSGVKPSSVLVFSFIGYKTQEIPCSGRQEINVVLSEDAQALDEVVVVGYGSLSKKELSSSIVQVDRSKFLQGSMNNPMEMLTGKVAGLTVNNRRQPIRMQVPLFRFVVQHLFRHPMTRWW